MTALTSPTAPDQTRDSKAPKVLQLSPTAERAAKISMQKPLRKLSNISAGNIGGRVPPSPLKSLPTMESLLSPRPGTGSFPPLGPFGNGTNGNHEAEGLDQWINEFKQFDSTLQQMAKASEDIKFTEELNTIERWFEVLSEAEKTATAYTLLQHSNPSQVKFLIAVLQQMARVEATPGNGTPSKEVIQKLQLPQTPAGKSPLSFAPLTPTIILNDNIEGEDLDVPSPPLSPEGDQKSNKNAPPAYDDVEDEGQEIEVRLPSASLSAALSGPLDWASMVPTPQIPMFQRNPHLGIPSPSPKAMRSPGGFINPSGLPYSPLGSSPGGPNPFQTGFGLNGMGMGVAGAGAGNGLPMGMGWGMGGAFSPGTMNDVQLWAMQVQMMMNNMAINSQCAFQPTETKRFPASPVNGVKDANTKKANTGSNSAAPIKDTVKNGNWRSRTTSAGDVSNALSATLPSRPTRTPVKTIQSGFHGEDDFNPDVLKDIPGWFKSLRLHKYTPCFAGLKWQEMVVLSEEELERRGVAALGARRRMMKIFGVVRAAMDIGPKVEDR